MKRVKQEKRYGVRLPIERKTKGVKNSRKPLCPEKKPIPLPIRFWGKGEVKGFLFIQIVGAPVYIYLVFTGYSFHYEVFKSVIDRRLNAVQYPKSGAFGLYAKTCKSWHQLPPVVSELGGDPEVLRFGDLQSK